MSGQAEVRSAPAVRWAAFGVLAALVVMAWTAWRMWQVTDVPAAPPGPMLSTDALITPARPESVDVDAAVTEIHEAADRGLRGVMIPTRWFDSPAYHEPVYEPVWAAVAERGLVLHTHSGAGPADYELGPGFMAIYATEAYWWAARPLWVLLWAGVFVLARNLWVVAANHAAWNFTILLSGMPLSGIEDWRKLAPLESRFAGPDWLTGGMFGPESSLLVIVSTTIAVALLLRAARRRGVFLVPAT